MSYHDDFIFPRDMHLPPPDWPALHALMLADGLIVPPYGRDVPLHALMDLRFALARAVPGSYAYAPALACPADIVRDWVRHGYLPADVPMRDGMSVREVLAVLVAHGIPVPLHAGTSLDGVDGITWYTEQHRPGPAFFSLVGRPYDPGEAGGMSIALFAQDGGRPFVAVGENLCKPAEPGVYPTQKLDVMPPFGNHAGFIEAVWEGGDVRWVSPKTGRAYRLFDLDWGNTLGMGRRIVRLAGMEFEDVERLAEHLSGVAGCPMCHSHRML